MSHTKERAEKDCLNCGAVVQGTYCHICGQANTETKETLWGLIQHFVYDITHFDGKFFSSLRYLLFRPGFLSYEYMRGRRASYLNPVRMYIFTAAIFFVLLFSQNNSAEVFKMNNIENTALRAKLMAQLDTLSTPFQRDSIRERLARLETAQVIAEMYEFASYDSAISDVKRDSIKASLNNTSGRSKKLIGFGNKQESLEAYEREQAAAKKKDGWLERYFKKKVIGVNERYRGRGKDFFSDFGDKFLHSLPTMMFISMPLVAAFLMLLNVRRRSRFYFASHAILVIHVYIAIYIILMLMIGVGWLQKLPNLHFMRLAGIALGLYAVYYVFRSMRVFYGQSFSKTLLKFLILSFFLTVLMTMLTVVFVVNTFINI